MRLTRVPNFAVGLVLLVAVLPERTVGQVPQPAPDALAVLTVPEARLPEGCRLRPDAPPAPPAGANRPPLVVVPSALSFGLPSNPWTGSDPRHLIKLRKELDAPPRLPDAPPPSRRELAAMEEEWVSAVTKGYRAEYIELRPVGDVQTASTVLVGVTALRFDSPPGAAMGDSARARSGLRHRIMWGSTVIEVSADRRTTCFDAVDAYISQLR